MLNDKRGPVGKMLKGISPEYREASFMGGQLGAFYSATMKSKVGWTQLNAYKNSLLDHLHAPCGLFLGT